MVWWWVLAIPAAVASFHNDSEILSCQASCLHHFTPKGDTGWSCLEELECGDCWDMCFLIRSSRTALWSRRCPEHSLCHEGGNESATELAYDLYWRASGQEGWTFLTRTPLLSFSTTETYMFSQVSEFRVRAGSRRGIECEVTWSVLGDANSRIPPIATGKVALFRPGNLSQHDLSDGSRVLIYQSGNPPDSPFGPVFMLSAFGMGLVLGLLVVIGLLIRHRRRREKKPIEKDPFPVYPPITRLRNSVAMVQGQPRNGRLSLLPTVDGHRIHPERTTSIDIAPSSIGITPIMRSTPSGVFGGRLSPTSQQYPRMNTFSVIAQVEKTNGEYSTWDGDIGSLESVNILSREDNTTTRRLEEKLRNFPSPSKRSWGQSSMQERSEIRPTLNASTSCPHLSTPEPHVRNIVSLFENLRRP